MNIITPDPDDANEKGSIQMDINMKKEKQLIPALIKKYKDVK
ncbi:18382_t:CDS:2 [Entrophospora sp. SA101]|nr:18382_t:CDS:2 [Entrophospora sp. SA101]